MTTMTDNSFVISPRQIILIAICLTLSIVITNGALKGLGFGGGGSDQGQQVPVRPIENFRFDSCPAEIQKLEQTDGGLSLVKDEVCAVFKGIWVTTAATREWRKKEGHGEEIAMRSSHHDDDKNSDGTDSSTRGRDAANFKSISPNDHNVTTWQGNPPTLWQMFGFPIIEPTDNLLGRTNEKLGLDKADLAKAATQASEDDPHPDHFRSSLFVRGSKILEVPEWHIEYQSVFAQSVWLAIDGKDEEARAVVGRICAWW